MGNLIETEIYECGCGKYDHNGKVLFSPCEHHWRAIMIHNNEIMPMSDDESDGH